MAANFMGVWDFFSSFCWQYLMPVKFLALEGGGVGLFLGGGDEGADFIFMGRGDFSE